MHTADQIYFRLCEYSRGKKKIGKSPALLELHSDEEPGDGEGDKQVNK